MTIAVKLSKTIAGIGRNDTPSHWYPCRSSQAWI